MQHIGAAWLDPLIIVAGTLQAWGPPTNGALHGALTNSWPASLLSFLPIVAFLGVLLLCQPRRMPTADGTREMPWRAPLGGLVGAFAVIAGLLFVNKVGAGAFAGLTIVPGRGSLRPIRHGGARHQHLACTPGLPMLAGIALVAMF